MEDRLKFLESRLTRLERIMYLILIMTAPNVLSFIQTLA